MLILAQILFSINNIVNIFILCKQFHLSLLFFDIYMSFQKLKSDFYCVGGRQRSATSKIYGDIFKYL